MICTKYASNKAKRERHRRLVGGRGHFLYEMPGVGQLGDAPRKGCSSRQETLQTTAYVQPTRYSHICDEKRDLESRRADSIKRYSKYGPDETNFCHESLFLLVLSGIICSPVCNSPPCWTLQEKKGLIRLINLE